MFDEIHALLESVSEATANKKEKVYFYHLSEQPLEPGTVFSPRVPENYMTQKDLEDNYTPRVCFGTTILGALKGINGDLKGKTYSIYVPANMETLEVHYPTDKEVPDATDLGEVWILNDVEMLEVGKIKVTDWRMLETEYGGDNRKVKRDDYDYEWVGGKNVAMIGKEELVDRKNG